MNDSDGGRDDPDDKKRNWSDACDGCSACDGCGACDGCDGCDLFLLSLNVSTLLGVAALLAPRRHGRRLVLGLIRGYQRWLSRFTPHCPATPSCSAFALAAVASAGPRRGLAEAARRVRECGRAPVSAAPSAGPSGTGFAAAGEP